MWKTDWLPVITEERYHDKFLCGLIPNPASENFDKLPKAMDGYVYFWAPAIRVKCIRNYTEITWEKYARYLCEHFLNDPLVFLTFLCNKPLALIPNEAEEVFENIVNGLSQEIMYDFRKFHPDVTVYKRGQHQ